MLIRRLAVGLAVLAVAPACSDGGPPAGADANSDILIDVLGLEELGDAAPRIAGIVGHRLVGSDVAGPLSPSDSPRGATAVLADGRLSLYTEGRDSVVALYRWFEPGAASFSELLGGVRRVGSESFPARCVQITSPGGYSVRVGEVEALGWSMRVLEWPDSPDNGVAIGIGEVSRFVTTSEADTRADTRC